MLIHNHPLFRIYFGDVKDKLFSKDFKNLPKGKKVYDLEQFSRLKKVMQLKALVFLNQTHSAEGLVVTSIEQAKEIKCFSLEGDYLITNVPKVGLGVMTADCLPVVFFDKRNFAVAIAHIGWRGAVKQIVVKTIDKMQKSFNTEVEDIKVIFGPSAKTCCYKVSEDFIENLEEFEFLDRVVQRREDGLYFDLPKFNIMLLQGLGVKKEAIFLKYNDCTICDELFFSCRRCGQDGGRQMTVVCLT
ncbi:peptidoglycan editing factor PgeF [Candidatus Dependentiae bacterium]